jgi:hypothetical protein
MAGKKRQQGFVFGKKPSLDIVYIQHGTCDRREELPPDNIPALLSSMFQNRTVKIRDCVETLLGFGADLILVVSHKESICRLWGRIPGIPGGFQIFDLWSGSQAEYPLPSSGSEVSHGSGMA